MKTNRIIIIYIVLSFIGGILWSCEKDLDTEAQLLPPYEGKESIPLPDFVEKLDNPYWSWVEKYPGLVGDSVPRLESVTVKINAVYQPMSKSCRISYKNVTPWFSTGLYAAPAEIIQVIRPASLGNKKISWRIGATHCVLDPEKVKLERYHNIVTTGELEGDTTRIYNYFGGNIYLIPEEPFNQPEEFIFKGAVKSPDFVLGETDPQEWLREIQQAGVPTAEIGGKRHIWTIPVRHLKNVTNPTEVAGFYEDVIEHDYNAFHGLTGEAGSLHGAPDYPSRSVPDIQVCAGTAHAGYPAMYSEVFGERAVNIPGMKTSNDAWGFYHEIGHNYQNDCWKWLVDGTQSIGEVSNNLDIFYSRNRLSQSWPEGVDTWGDIIKLYVLVENEEKNFDATEDENKVINKDKARLIPFVQLAQKYGWGLYAYLGKCSRELSDALANDLSKDKGRREFFCRRVCEYANADLRPFFDAWGIKYGITTRKHLATLPAYSGEEFWKTWNEKQIPSFEYHEPTGVKLPDDDYNAVPEGDIDRSNWQVVAYEGKLTADGTVTGNDMAAILDGNETSCALFIKKGNNYNGVTGTDPINFTIDMGEKESFSYLRLKNRVAGSNIGFNPTEITLWGSNDGITFTPVKENLTIPKPGDKENKLVLGQQYEYRYVKIEITKYPADGRLCVAVSEVYLGL